MVVSSSRFASPLVRNLLLSASVSALVLSAGAGSAQVFTGPGTDWNTASNWAGGVPGAGSLAEVILPTTTGIPATLSGSVGITDNLHIDGDNQVLVSGSILSVAQTVSIGRNAVGTESLLRAENLSLVTATDVFVGDGVGVGLLEVDGGGTAVLADRLVVGGLGGGSLDITNGGSVIVGTSIENATVTGQATIDVRAFSSLTGGSLANRVNSVLDNAGFMAVTSVDNAGLLNNSGIVISGGGITNSGVVNNFAGPGIQATGDIVNNSGGFINNDAGAALATTVGNITNNVGGTLVNGGLVSSSGSFNNFGNATNTGTVQAAGAVINGGTFTNTTGLLDGASVQNSGTLTNGGGGTVRANTGDFVNFAGGSVLNSGIIRADNNNDIINQGQIANSGTLRASGDVFNMGGLTNLNNGLVTALGDINNSGTFDNQAGATVDATVTSVNNAGTFTNAGRVNGLESLFNAATGTFTSSGVVTGGSVINQGLMTNLTGGSIAATTDNVDNAGTLDNRVGAAITSAMNVNNAGTLSNAGSVAATRMVMNSSLIDNSGSITAGTGVANSGTINNLAAGAVLQATGGNIANSGTINNAAGALVAAQAGSVINSGVVSNFGGVTAAQIILNSMTLTNAGSVTGGTGVTNIGTLTNNAGFITATTGNVTNLGTLNNAVGATVRALSGDVANQGGTINNGGTVTASGMITNNATLNNAGTVVGGTGVTNTVTINNVAGATLQATTGDVANNAGTITNAGTVSAGGMVRNNATLNNSGTVTAGTGIFNSGTLNNNGAGAIVQATTGNVTNVGMIANTGIVRALAGDVTISAGSVTNGGSISASALFQNFSSLVNTGSVTAGTGILNGGVANNSGTYQTVTGNFTNTGTVTNLAGGLVAAQAGNVVNNFTFTNFGAVTAGLQFQNSGNFHNGGSSTAGTVTAGAGISNTGTLTNNRGFVTATTGNIANLGTLTNSVFGTVRALAGSITNGAGNTINSGGTLSASVALTNAGTLFSSGHVAAPTVTNSGQATMSGQLTATTVNNTGAFNIVGNLIGTTGAFNNNAGGVVNLTGGDYTNVGTFNNASTLNVIGNRTIGTATTFNNLGTGTVSMVNNIPTDRFTVLGSYVGTAGSQVGLDIDLSQGNASTADRLTVQNGTGSGTSSLQFNISNTGRSSFANPIPVFVLLNGGSVNGLTGPLSGTDSLGRPANFGFFSYSVQQTQPGTYAVVSQFNSAPVQGVASGLSGMVTALQAGFHQPASAIISRPDNCSPNQFMGGPFVRLNGGDTKITSTSAGSGGGVTFSGPSSSKADFKGIQGGIDAGICNVQGSGWNIHVGVMGGFVEVNSRGVSQTRDQFNTLLPVTTTSIKVDVPFLGLYTFVTKDNFVFEANIRKDYYRAKVTASDVGSTYVGPNQRVKGEGLNYNFSASYRFNIGESAYFEPSVGFSKGSTTFNRLQFATAATDFMTFSRSESLLGRLGFNAGYTILASDRLALVPFLHASIWHEFAGRNRAVATIGGMGQTFEVRTDRVGTFGQVGVGLQFKVLNSPFLGFVRGDVRFGDRIEGKAVNAGLRMQF